MVVKVVMFDANYEVTVQNTIVPLGTCKVVSQYQNEAATVPLRTLQNSGKVKKEVLIIVQVNEFEPLTLQWEC